MTIATPSPLRILTWNVLAPCYVTPERYPASSPSHLDPAARRYAQADLLIGLNPDVAALQEADAALVDHLTHLRGASSVVWLPRHGRVLDGCALVIGSSTTLVSYEEITLPSYTTPARVAQVATLSVRGRTFAIANVHLSYAQPGNSEKSALVLEQISAVLASLANQSPDLHLVVGDLNAYPRSPVRALLSQYGLTEYQRPGPTAYVDSLPATLDVIASSLPATYEELHHDVLKPLPSSSCPSDHVPLMVRVS